MLGDARVRAVYYPLFYFIFFYFIIFCLFYFILFYSILFYFILFYFIYFYTNYSVTQSSFGLAWLGWAVTKSQKKEPWKLQKLSPHLIQYLKLSQNHHKWIAFYHNKFELQNWFTRRELGKKMVQLEEYYAH